VLALLLQLTTLVTGCCISTGTVGSGESTVGHFSLELQVGATAFTKFLIGTLQQSKRKSYRRYTEQQAAGSSMSGRLIILPKKSWHVWRRDNIERVKRDERLAAEAEEALEQKQRDIEQELRIETLKKRRQLSSSSSSSAAQAKATGKDK
jgi:hypothetical protein